MDGNGNKNGNDIDEHEHEHEEPLGMLAGCNIANWLDVSLAAYNELGIGVAPGNRP